MPIPQGNEGEGTGGAVGGRAITRSILFAPEGLGPEGVSGEGAAPGLVGGAGGTSDQRPQRELRAPRRLIEEVGAPSSQPSGQARGEPSKGDGDHVLKVSGMYWLEYVNQNMPKAHWQRFVARSRQWREEE